MITVRFFAMLRDRAGTECMELDLRGPVRLSELRDIITHKIPSLSEVLESPSILVSVNQEFATPDTEVKDGDEVAFLPPFSGG